MSVKNKKEQKITSNKGMIDSDSIISIIDKSLKHLNQISVRLF